MLHLRRQDKTCHQRVSLPDSEPFVGIIRQSGSLTGPWVRVLRWLSRLHFRLQTRDAQPACRLGGVGVHISSYTDIEEVRWSSRTGRHTRKLKITKQYIILTGIVLSMSRRTDQRKQTAKTRSMLPCRPAPYSAPPQLYDMI